MREARLRACLTQRQLAERLGVAPNTVARWERGERPIDERTAIATRTVTEARPESGPVPTETA